MKKFTLAGLVLLVSASALADECGNATTQLELNDCAAQQYQAADKKLNATYQAAYKTRRRAAAGLTEESPAGVDRPARCGLRLYRIRYRRR